MYILSVKEVCQWFLFQLSYINITFFTNSANKNKLESWSVILTTV